MSGLKNILGQQPLARAVLIAVAVVMLLGSVTLLVAQNQFMSRSLQNKAELGFAQGSELMTAHMANGLRWGRVNAGPKAYNDTLKDENAALEGVVITNAAGALIAQDFDAGPTTPLAQDLRETLRAHNADVRTDPVSFFDRPDHVIVIAAVINDQTGEMLGTAGFAWSKAIYRGEVWELSALNAILSLVLCLVVMGAVNLVVRALVIRPIKSINTAMTAVADGGLDTPVPYADHNNEIGQMADAVEVFKTNGLERLRLAAERKQARQEREAEAEATQKKIEQERQATLQRLSDAFMITVAQIAAGDLDARVDESFDEAELTQMADALNTLAETVQVGLRESRKAMAAIAEYNLTVRVSGEYAGEFEDLKTSVNNTGQILSHVVAGMQTTLRGLGASTETLQAGVSDLSNRTIKQAAAIEETSAATEHLSQTVKNNAERADRARTSADRAHAIANEGGAVMNDATAAIDRIAQSSAKISDIIGLIDNIAFQTNLLALNASVEAARAGEAGKGFAVVASEVRRLAQSAGDASQEVKALIDDGAGEVREGVDLVSKAAQSLEAIVESVGDVTQLMNEIASDSREQARSLDEVNSAVRNLDEMTQSNAALAEQTSSALSQVAAQVGQIEDMANNFKTVDPDATPQDGEAGGDLKTAA